MYLSGNEELPKSRTEEAVPPSGNSRLIWGFILYHGVGGGWGGVLYLKGVWHEIFDLRFFSWISVPQAPKYSIPFWIFSKIRGDIREWIFIAGDVDTGDKLFSGVNDTGEKFIPGVNDTGD